MVLGNIFLILAVQVGCCLFQISQFIHIKEGLGLGSNNFAEFQVLKLLLKCAKDWNISRLQVYGDSLLVINWRKRSGHLHNVNIRPLGNLLLEIAGSFEHISFAHVYRELNQDDDKLSKEGQHLPKGHIYWKEVNAGDSVCFFTTLVVGLVSLVLLVRVLFSVYFLSAFPASFN